MKRLIILLLLIPHLLAGQTSQIDSLIRTIPFKQDSIRSIFEWVANNIQYDVTSHFIPATIRTYQNEDLAEKIKLTLQTRKGVCHHYASLFNALVTKAGYTAYVVKGYTSHSPPTIGHAWNVIKINGKWYCFDPTWASGSIPNNTFIPSFNDTWYQVEPAEFLQTHIPYDPTWQLSEYPVIASHGNPPVAVNEYYNFEDSIRTYQNEQQILFLQNQILRVSKYNHNNPNVNNYLEILNLNLNSEKDTKIIDLFNNTVSSFNAYVHYRNSGFKQPKLNFSEIKALLTSMQTNLEEVKTLHTHSHNKNSEKGLKFSSEIRDLESKVGNELVFIKKYEKWNRRLAWPFK